MPFRSAVAKELAELCKVIAHPDRIRIVEELNVGSKDVNSLAKLLEISGSRVSQHLALLRAHRYVTEERSGRHHFYQLTQPRLATWLLDGLEFIETRGNSLTSDQIERARRIWAGDPT